MESLALQDRASLRRFFAQYDPENCGVMGLDGFSRLLGDFGAAGQDLKEEEIKGFMLKMGGSKRGDQFSLMYEDFQKKMLGMPHGALLYK